jgi:ATP-dependent DNA ligase
VKQHDDKKEEHPLEFASLAHSFEKLEKTSSRLALIAILAELFRLIESPDEIEKVCYLLQGRVAPSFEALEIGMAEKTVARSIAIAYHTTPEHVFTLYATLGDLGLVAEQFSKQADSVILDAEALAYHPASEEFLPFQQTSRRRRKYRIEAMAQQMPLKAFVFDILYKNGASLLKKPLG